MDRKYDDLMTAAHLALGWIIAKDGFGSDVGYSLAKGLYTAGSESTYVKDLIESRGVTPDKNVRGEE